MRTVALLLLCLMLILSSCARFGGGGNSPGPSEGKPDDPIGATPGDELPPAGDGSLREEPDPTVFDPRGTAVDHFTIGPDGRTLVVYWWGGNTACFGLKAIEVDVHGGTPIITVLDGTRGAARDRMCTMEAVLKSAAVTLDQPILVDSANPDAEPGEAPYFPDAIRVRPMEGITDPRPHAISGYALSADGLTLSIYFVGGREECYGLAEATTERDGESGQVTVSVREGWRADGDAACDDIGVVKVVKVSLDEPLIVSAAFDSESQEPTS